MSKVNRFLRLTVFTVLALIPILSACTPAAPTAAAPQAQPTSAAPAATSAPAQPTALPTAGSFSPTEAPAEPAATTAPAEGAPTVGGRLVYAAAQQPDTLDIQKSGFGITNNVSTWIGGTLVAKDIEGNYIPYLADSWEISEDGLTWTLSLKEGVLFHNGDPLRAEDWVYTINRAKDPATQSPIAKGLVDPITTVEAVDEYTLRFTLEEPFYPLLENLTSGYLEPYSQRAVEEAGENYGRNPVSVGPYRFKEWRADEYILLERNPDYTWGPELYEGANTGPAYIEEIEYRVLPEYATQLAALESGDVDMIYPQAKDVAAIEAQGDKSIFNFISTATFHLIVNHTVAPFDNPKVREAFAQAIDRESIIQVATNGQGAEVRGPLTPSVVGYNPAIEQVGFGFDLEAARQALEEAGYTYGSDGMATMNGQPLRIVLKTPTIDYYVRISQILVEQFRALGVETEIQQFEWGTLSPQYLSGDFQIGTLEVGWPEADILYLWFHSSQIGTFWGPRVGYPELDTILEQTRTSTDPVERQEFVNQAQEYVARNLLMIPILAMPEFNAVNERVVGEQFSPFFGSQAAFISAYIQE